MHRIYLPDRVEEAVLYTQLQEQTPLREPLLELPDFLPDIAMEAAGMTVALGLWGSSQAHAPSFTLAGNTSPTSWLLRGSLPPGHPRCVHAAMSEGRPAQIVMDALSLENGDAGIQAPPSAESYATFASVTHFEKKNQASTRHGRFHYKNVKLSTRPACTHYHTPTTELYAKND
ncbi:hypothetical protein MG293_019276 [Ovis ammon polii]|uniref:Uncharacterized protein n=1 Tax=Ovis ammon polii TaxID=230172 RepID=A0AAD4TLM8_OVIAM|nr:hypothetical protein MG293_019276 [Ovis ammon polii]